MDLKLLETLKEMIASEKVLSTIMEYFLDHFGEVPAFRKIGHKARNEVVESFLNKIAILWNQGDPVPNGVMLIEIPEYQFIHGGVMYQQGILNILYFDDIKTGLVVSGGSGIRQPLLMRFSMENMPAGFESRN